MKERKRIIVIVTIVLVLMLCVAFFLFSQGYYSSGSTRIQMMEIDISQELEQ